MVVTDGFSGNIALKTAEGTARFVTDLLRRAFKSSLRSKAGFALSRPALNLLKHHLDPNNHNGAVFLGLNGLVVKSHGSATPRASPTRSTSPRSMVRHDITRKIGDDLDNFRAHAFANGARAMICARSSLASAARCPGGEVTNEELAQTRRHDRRVDRRAHRDSQPLCRGRGRNHRDPRHRRGAPRARPCRHRCDRHRPDRPGDGDPRPDLPVVGDQGPGGAWHPRLHRLRRPRRLHRLPLCAVGRRFDASRRATRKRRW